VAGLRGPIGYERDGGAFALQHSRGLSWESGWRTSTRDTLGRCVSRRPVIWSQRSTSPEGPDRERWRAVDPAESKQPSDPVWAWDQRGRESKGIPVRLGVRPLALQPDPWARCVSAGPRSPSPARQALQVKRWSLPVRAACRGGGLRLQFPQTEAATHPGLDGGIRTSSGLPRLKRAVRDRTTTRRQSTWLSSMEVARGSSLPGCKALQAHTWGSQQGVGLAAVAPLVAQTGLVRRCGGGGAQRPPAVGAGCSMPA